jgi:hypothetical protein
LAVACSSAPAGPTAADRTDWKQWAETFVGAACNHDQACGVEVGAACCAFRPIVITDSGAS